MPGAITTPRSSSPSSDEGSGYLSGSAPYMRDEYPAFSPPGYAEKPLEEQLEPIAVVGMGCRLPGDVSSASEFWDMLMTGKSGQTPKVPANRFNIDAHWHKNKERPGSFPVWGGYFINEDLENFDPGLFNITPIEAMWMDPQQRKLLEVTYEALESGGISLEAVAGSRTGVFAASFTSDWQQMSFKEPSFRHTMAATGVDPGILSDRISYVFNLNGPSVLTNTACSSSIYALHNACIALRNNECDGAIVGGTNLVFTVDQQMNTAKIGVLSPRSTCSTFDESADGYGRAEGVGAVYVKRLSDAIRDGDPVRAIVRGSSVNHNGKASSASISYPGKDGQAYVMDDAYKRAGNFDPLLTGYFETHGTGTAVGDPIEAEAIGIAMNRNRRPGIDAPLMIGAVKTNIGHGEAASGLTALIKSILIVERGIIPPTIGIKKLSSKIKWDEWQIQVPTVPTPFPAHLPFRRVSVNTCGYGGTNAHVIIEEAKSILRHPQTYKFSDPFATSGSGGNNKLAAPRRTSHRKRPFLLPFSANDKVSLKANIEAHAKVVDKYNLVDLSYTLGNRRSVLASKGFTVASHKTLKDAFSSIDSSFTFAEKKRAAPTVGFVFTGQGSQWPRMGAELMEYSETFLATIRHLDQALDELSDGPEWSIEDVLLEFEATSPVGEAEFSQPLCTAVQIALVDLLADWGVQPAVTVGHSSGEIAAAYAAGLISAKEAITAAYYRGKVTKDVKEGGAMMAVGLGAEAVSPYLADVNSKVVVACHNSPSGVTLSGDSDVLDSLKAKFDAENIFARGVKTNGKAYHSHYMVPVSETYEGLFKAARAYTSFEEPSPRQRVKMVSSVTNSILSETTVLDESYWSANLRSPVLFNQAVQTILTASEFSDVDLLIEIGPHSAMAGPVKQIKTELKAEKLEYVPTLLRNTDSAVQLLKFAGELFLRSYPMKMERVTSAYVDAKGSKGNVIVDLPRYQWNYTRQFWPESRASKEHRRATHGRHDVLGQLVIGASSSEPTWRNILRIRDLPWLNHHFLGGEAVFPAAGYFSMAIEAVTQLNERSENPVEVSNYVLRDVSIKKALVTPDNDDGIEVVTNFRPSVYGSGWWDFSVSSIDQEGTKKEHMAGSISINTSSPRGEKKPRQAPEFSQVASGKSWNQALREVGFNYGPTFQDMDNIRFNGKDYEASCTTNIKQIVDESIGESRYVLHPAIVDSTLQLSIVAIYAGRTNAMDCGVVPVQVDEVTIWPPTKEQVETSKASAYAWVDRRGIRSFENSVQMTADNGEMVMEIVNVRTTAYEAAVPTKDDTALKPAPYGEMAWELDIDSLETTATSGVAASELASLVLFKYPGSKVLEVGTKAAISVLKKNPQALYTIAAASDEEEVAKAKASVEEFANAKVAPLDPSEELEAQSFAAASYDIVIASSELLPTVRSLIKPGGFAITADKSSIEKTATPAEETETEAASTGDAHKVELIYRASQTAILSQIKTALQALGWSVGVSSLEACAAPDYKVGHAVMLADFEGPLLFSITEKEFVGIQNITNSASSLLWVTNGGLLDGKRPEYAMASGLARSVKSEQISLDFRTLDFDTDNAKPTEVTKIIAQIAKLQQSKSEEEPEREYCVKNGKTYISRLVRNPALNEMFSTAQEPQPTQYTPGEHIAGKVLGGKVVFEQLDATAAAEVKPGHVEVQVQVAGVSKEGVLVITGSDYPTTFSHELGGIVTAVGSGVTGFAKGDRVVGFNIEKYSSFQQVPANLLAKIAADADMSVVVSTLLAYATAGYGFDFLAYLKPKETVLVLNGTGTTGAAAIKIAQALGGIPYAVAKTDDEVAFLSKELGLASEYIIKSADGLIANKIDQITNGRGVDVVFSAGSAVNPAEAREAWRHIARFGRFVDAGHKDVLSRSALDTVPVRRGALYLPFDILQVLESRPEPVAGLLPKIVDLLKNGIITAPGAVERVPLGEIDKAVASFSDAFGAAKSVLQYAASEIPALPPKRARLQFSADVTYLLVGCLGGLGRSLTSWMMESGARRFAFLSRSGTDSKSAARLVSDIEAKGAIVQVVRGDATNREDVVRAVKEIPAQYPIRGVVHAAMVLRDGMFHAMPFSSWTVAVAPKVQGALNLHSVLASTPLDFFLMTSSVSGILGTPGQSNYAAANSYLDALSRHRVSSGLSATACVIPMVLGVGVVAENLELEDSLKRKGMYGIDEEHLLQSFEAGIASKAIKPVPDHVVIGLDPALLQKAVADEAATDSFWLEDARFSHVVHAMNSSTDTGASGGGQNVLAAIKSAPTPADALQIVQKHFIEKLARMLLLVEDEVDPNSGSIASYGIDSMIGAELRNWIFKEFRMDIPFQQLLAPTLIISKFSKQVLETVGITA